MPLRKIPLIKDYVYHILNRGTGRVSIFYDKNDFSRFIETMYYYQLSHVPLRFSFFKKLDSKERLKILNEAKTKLVDIIAYCLMPNHFHFVLKQLEENGITIFIKKLTNSYGKYFNLKYKREGLLFQGRFKAVLVENDSQLLHLVRYLHLNPYASAVIGNIKELENYPWSSYPAYIKKGRTSYLATDMILSHFRSIKPFREFTLDQADYAKKLAEIKHLSLEH